MALARAFTTIGRRNRTPQQQEDAPISTFIGRAASQRQGRPVLREHISSPLALVSTSNMNLHDAQNIAGTKPIDIRAAIPSSGASDTSDNISGDETCFSSPGSDATITDASSVDEAMSPLRTEPEPNHLSCYFKPAVNTGRRPSYSRGSTSASTTSSLRASQDTEDTPRLPQRVPSHSKKAHERLHRTRSLQRMISPSPAAPTIRRAFTDNLPENSTSSSTTFVEAPLDINNPFSYELAQLDEVAEEFGQVTQRAEVEAERAFLVHRGLACYAAEEYACEIQALVLETFGALDRPVETWI